tara:strand:+ start:4397 stop:6106 length:1710 start_codon:yes stop_codon:yes gene_type:complete
MAIQNASDLLVYAKTTDPAKQKTRIRVLTTDPMTLADGETTGRLNVSNATDDGGVVRDNVTTAAASNTGTSVMAELVTLLTNATMDYDDISGSNQTDGNYIYRDFENGAVGLVPTLQITDGTVSPIGTLNEDAIIIEIVTPGSSAIFDPVAFSTSASFSTNMDLRDVTNKDSNGWSESLGGLKSFEVSTDILQSINPDVPLDGTDFFDKLKNRSLVDLSFSDRIRNIIRTNLTQSGVDGFLLGGLTQTNLQTDPFSGSTASKLVTGASTTNKYLGYTIDATRVENKKVNWSFYVKGSGSTTQASFALSNSSIVGASTVTKIEGQGTIAFVATSYYKITGLSTSAWTRISFQTDTINLSGSSTFSFYIYPGLYSAQDSDEIFTSSWQIELSPEATNYQDPTDITHWQGNALVSSLSFDAGVEDNLTCSATFTGTSNVYPNGLGPELIADTSFDDPSYWSVSPGTAGTSVVEDGYGKILSTGANSDISKDLNLYATPGDYFLLTYTIHTSTDGELAIHDGWDNSTEFDLKIPSTVGTHKVLLKPGDNSLIIKRAAIPTTIWLSSISLKKVL